MDKLLLFLFFIVLGLLSVACGGAATFPSESSTAPEFTADTPDLLLWGIPRENLSRYDLTANGTRHDETKAWQGDVTQTTSEPYYVVDNTLIQQTGSYYSDFFSGQLSPNGQWVADAGIDYLHLRRTDEAGLLRLAENGGPFHPVWSPDGRWLAYVDADGLWAVDTAQLASQQLLARPSLQPLAWSADNGQLLFSEDKSAIILDVDAQTERSLQNVDASQIRGQPAWSPDGQTIYATYEINERSDFGISTVEIHQVALSRLVTIATDGRRNPIEDLLPTGKDRGAVHFALSPDGQSLAVDFIACHRAQSNLIPILRTRQCKNSLLVVQTDNGAYMTLRESTVRLSLTFAWARPWSMIDFATLPQPPETIPRPPTPTPPVRPAPLPSNMTPFGETAVSDIWELTIQEQRRGAEAWAFIEATPNNEFNQLAEPAPGYEYVLTLIDLRYIGSEERSPIIWRNHFDLLDAEGAELEHIRVGALPPPLFEPPEGRIPAGESEEAWLVFLAPEGAEVTLQLDRSLFEQPLYLAVP